LALLIILFDTPRFIALMMVHKAKTGFKELMPDQKLALYIPFIFASGMNKISSNLYELQILLVYNKKMKPQFNCGA
jgi:hypothetical protein